MLNTYRVINMETGEIGEATSPRFLRTIVKDWAKAGLHPDGLTVTITNHLHKIDRGYNFKVYMYFKKIVRNYNKNYKGDEEE